LDRDDPEDPVCREIEYYGAGEPALVNGMRVYATWGGSTFSADAVARVGRLMMHHGKWNGIQCVSERWIERALQPNGTERLFDPSVEPPMAQGLGWLLNTNKSLRQAPRDAFVGAGRGLQVLLVVPSLDLIAVRFGRYSGEDFWGEAERNFVNPVLESVL
jgi:CubicO group peptidase (beta-lactamase class C family)